MADSQLIELTADIVSAHVSHNDVPTADVPSLIRNIFEALTKAVEPTPEESPKLEPAVSIRASVKSDHIVCLEDGAKLTMLKRHLRTHFDMSPTEYRAKWSLPRDYPMVAPNYAERRRALALQIGLGRKRSNKNVAPETDMTAIAVEAPAPAPKAKRARKRLGISVAKDSTETLPAASPEESEN
jgi:predicted transcriptional regulator